MPKKVFIVGNGFDLDIGWNTDYRHFIASDYWPLKGITPNCQLAEFLAEKTEIDLWYDLEMILKNYASSNSLRRKVDPNDEVFFEQLKSSLTDYLKNEETKDVDNDSLAIKVLKSVFNNGYFSSIYSFNYTDLNNIALKAGMSSRFEYAHVHGCVKNNSIILGVDDRTNLIDGYSFLRKVFSEHYTSHPIRYDLQECDEVVFFGHSLGETDYPYFADFFETQSQCVQRKDSKRITIFTKDNNSRFQILEQLRIMNAGQTERLQNDNNFIIIMTDNPNMVLLNRFFNDLSESSKRAYYRKLENMASMMP